MRSLKEDFHGRIIRNSSMGTGYFNWNQRVKKTLENQEKVGWLFLNHYNATCHKLWVMWYIIRICFVLLKRGLLHDLSKYSSRESASFRDWTIAIQNVAYDSDEYEQIATQFAKDCQIHYSANKHHPQYWPNGIDDMSPIDLIEMLCDWKAKSRNGKGIIRSIDINSERFNYDETFKNGLARAAKEAFPD